MLDLGHILYGAICGIFCPAALSTAGVRVQSSPVGIFCQRVDWVVAVVVCHRTGLHMLISAGDFHSIRFILVPHTPLGIVQYVVRPSLGWQHTTRP